MNNRQIAIDEALLRRVCSEFLEMPGLRLTRPQAQRLWGLDERTCAALLESLVNAKFLCRPGHGMYTRLTDGNTVPPQPRMIRAQIVDSMIHTTKETGDTSAALTSIEEKAS